MTDLYTPTKPADSTPRATGPFAPMDLWEQYLIGLTGPIAPAALSPRTLAKAPAPPQPGSKPWYRTPLCTLGIHRGQWAFVAKGDCTQTRTCERCAATHTRTKHRHEWQYIRKGSCLQNRACVRCEAVRGQRTHHEEWGETYEVSSNRDAHRCLRCGHVDTWSTDCGD